MLQVISIVLSWASVISLVCSCAAWAKGRSDNAVLTTLRKHHALVGGIACVVILAHGITSIVVAAQTHDYSQASVSAAHILLLLFVLVAVSGLVARKHPKPWRTVHGVATVLALVAVVVHVVAAIIG